MADPVRATMIHRIDVQRSDDVSRVRGRLRHCAQERGFSELIQTRMVTASSELARNLLQYAGGGVVRIEEVRRDPDGGARHEPGRDPEPSDVGLRVSFEDTGPGIGDIPQALTDGFSTSGGLGLGLSGARRLMNEFEISAPEGRGTRIVITQWRKVD